jgi:hypothetical protein
LIARLIGHSDLLALLVSITLQRLGLLDLRLLGGNTLVRNHLTDALHSLAVGLIENRGRRPVGLLLHGSLNLSCHRDGSESFLPGYLLDDGRIGHGVLWYVNPHILDHGDYLFNDMLGHGYLACNANRMAATAATAEDATRVGKGNDAGQSQ